MGNPISKEEFISRHSAFFQSIGFDVQFAAFIYYMLDLHFEDTIYYEEEDDFVIDRVKDGNTTKEYYQVKHSKDEKAKMTNADSDFWKTIENWIDLYNLTADDEKKAFFINGKFVILTNKEVDNKYYNLIVGLQNGLCSIDDVITEFNNADDSSYKPTLDKLVTLGKDLLNQFLHKITIVRFVDFLGEMYNQFLLLYRKPGNADGVLTKLVGGIWRDKLASSGKFYFTFETYSQKYKGILEQIDFSNTLTLETTEEPDLNLENQHEADNMVNQLKSVKAIKEESTKEDDFCAYYLTIFFKIKRTILNLKKQNIITTELEERLDKSAISKWKGIFIKNHTMINGNNDVTDSEKTEAGRKTLNETLEAKISVSKVDVEDNFAKGWFLRLSNALKITWHYDWYKKYNSEK